MKSIVFVCLGNICRSPIAEGCAKKLAKENNIELSVSSSGTGDWHIGERPCNDSVKVCQENGVDISNFTATQFTKKDIHKYDLIIALDDKNIASLKSLGAKNILKMGSYGYEGEDVPDPYFFDSYEGFAKVFSMIDECVHNLFKEEIFRVTKDDTCL